MIQVSSVCRVELLGLGRLPHFSDLLYFVGDLTLYLQWILCKDHVLLVAGNQDGDLLIDNIDVTEQVVNDLSSFTELVFFFRVKQDYNCLSSRGLRLERSLEVIVSWHVNKLCLNSCKVAFRGSAFFICRRGLQESLRYLHSDTFSALIDVRG